MGGTFFNYQTFSGNKLTLISHFTPFWHLFKPLVEIISQNKSPQTFREFKFFKYAILKIIFQIYILIFIKYFSIKT